MGTADVSTDETATWPGPRPFLVELSLNLGHPDRAPPANPGKRTGGPQRAARILRPEDVREVTGVQPHPSFRFATTTLPSSSNSRTIQVLVVPQSVQ